MFLSRLLLESHINNGQGMPKVDKIQVYWFNGRLFRSPVGEEAVLGAKDIIEKQLEDYNEVFADIVNGLLFDGEDVVK